MAKFEIPGDCNLKSRCILAISHGLEWAVALPVLHTEFVTYSSIFTESIKDFFNSLN